LFGVTGTAALTANLNNVDPVMLTVGGVMTLAGLLFKMSAAPFHLWAPDVYEATPSPVVAYLSVVPKLAALVVVLRIVDTLPVEIIDWTVVVAGFAMLSMVVGTLAALAQRDAKRMMAYSTVAQAGFLLTALASSTPDTADSIYATGFYALVFLLTNYLVFLVIQLREENGGTVLYEDFAGLGYKAVIPAVAITIAFVSLTGIPPVAGFTAKLLVFSTLWAKFETANRFIFVALFAVGLLATVAALFFYLKIPFFMFFRESPQKEPLKISPFTNFLLLFLVGLLFALFLFPSLFDSLGGWVIKVNFVI
jgi:NADH-quinone oxidoreductase subunit N